MFSYIRYKYSGQRIQIAKDTTSEPEEREAKVGMEQDGESKREKETEPLNWVREKLIFLLIFRVFRPLVKVIKRNKAHLYGTPREYSEFVGPEIPGRSVANEEPQKSRRKR